MLLIEDGSNEEILIHILHLLIQSSNYHSILHCIRYCMELIDSFDVEGWRCHVHLLLTLLQSIHKDEYIEKLLLKQHSLNVQHLLCLSERALSFENTFSFCLPSLFFTNPRQCVEKIIASCVQPGGYVNENLNQSFHYHFSLPLSLKRTVSDLLDIPFDLLDFLSLDNAIVKKMNETNLMDFTQEAQFVHNSLQPHYYTTHKAFNPSWNLYYHSMKEYLFTDIQTALVKVFQLISQQSSLREPLSLSIISLVSCGMDICKYFTIYSHSSVQMDLSSIWEHRIFMSIKKSSLPARELILPFPFYEEASITVYSSIMFDQLSTVLQYYIDHDRLSEDDKEEEDGIVSYFLNNQLELTSLPLLRSILPKKSMNIIIIKQQAITRFLQVYSNDLFSLMLSLRSLTNSEILPLIKKMLTPGKRDVNTIIQIGILYGYLLCDLSIIQEFTLFQFSYKHASGNSTVFLTSLPYTIQSLATNQTKTSIINGEDYLLVHMDELIELRHFLEEETSDFYVNVFYGCILANHPKALQKCIEITKSLVSPYLLYEIIQQSIQKLKGNEYAIVFLLYSYLKQFHEREHNEEIKRINQILFLADYFIQFNHNHPLHSFNASVFDIINSPWKHLHHMITIYNYRDYLLLLSNCNLSLSTIYYNLLQDVVSSPDCVFEWSILSNLLMNIQFETLSKTELFKFAKLCLEISKCYQEEGHFCSTFPCTLCQDRVESAEMAIHLYEQALDSQHAHEHEHEGAMMTKMGMKREIQDYTIEEKEITCNYQHAVFDYQRNRLLLGNEPAPNSIKHDVMNTAMMNKEDCDVFCIAFYIKVACAGGQVLQQHYSEFTQYLLMQSAIQSEKEEFSRKRCKQVNVKADTKEKSYELLDVESIESTDSFTQQSWNLFNEEGCGVLYCHSVMKKIASILHLDYDVLCTNVMDSLLMNVKKVEPSLMYALNQNKEKTIKENTINSLLYMIEGYHQRNINSLLSYFELVMNESNNDYPFYAKYLLVKTLLIVLQKIPSYQYEHYQFPSISLLQQRELELFILAGCQEFSISIGMDILSQASNPSFILSILNRMEPSSALLWWSYSLCQSLQLNNHLIWTTLLEKAEQINDFQLVLQCCYEKAIQLPAERLETIIYSINLDTINLSIMLKVLLKQFLKDEQICKYTKHFLQMASQRAFAEEDISLLSQFVMLISNSTLRKETLQEVISAPVDLLCVIRLITVNGKAIPLYKEELVKAFYEMMRRKQFSLLYFSNFYREVIQYCCKFSVFVNDWIVYHIKERHFKEAVYLIEKGHHKELQGEQDEISILRDFIIEVLKDEQLLPFLLTL